MTAVYGRAPCIMTRTSLETYKIAKQMLVKIFKYQVLTKQHDFCNRSIIAHQQLLVWHKRAHSSVEQPSGYSKMWFIKPSDLHQRHKKPLLDPFWSRSERNSFLKAQPWVHAIFCIMAMAHVISCQVLVTLVYIVYGFIVTAFQNFLYNKF